jgi:hypothetical protein
VGHLQHLAAQASAPAQQRGFGLLLGVAGKEQVHLAVAELEHHRAVVEAAGRLLALADETGPRVQHQPSHTSEPGQAVAGSQSVVVNALLPDQFPEPLRRPGIAVLAAVQITDHLYALQYRDQPTDMVVMRM